MPDLGMEWTDHFSILDFYTDSKLKTREKILKGSQQNKNNIKKVDTIQLITAWQTNTCRHNASKPTNLYKYCTHTQH